MTTLDSTITKATAIRSVLLDAYHETYALRETMSRTPLRIGQPVPTDDATMQHLAISRALDAIMEGVNHLSHVSPATVR